MDNNPLFPNSLKGWGIFAFLVVVYGAIYYIAGFPILWHSFQQMERAKSVTCWEGRLSRQDKAPPSPIIAGRIYYPIAVSDATTLSSFFTVWNDTNTPLKDVRFWMVHEKEDSVAGFFLPSFIKRDVLHRTLDVPLLSPHERVNFRVELLGSDGKVWRLNWSAVRGESRISGECVYGENHEDEIAILPAMPVAVALGLLERVLLPPWSNVVVLVVAFVAAGMLEDWWDKAGSTRVNYQKVLGLWPWAFDMALWGIVLLFLGTAYLTQRENWWQVVGFTFDVLIIAGVLWCIFKPCKVYTKGKRGEGILNILESIQSLWVAAIIGGVVLFGFGMLNEKGMWFFGGETVVAFFLLACALPILRQWRWDRELDLKHEEIKWQQPGKNKNLLSGWLAGWQRHLAVLEEDIGKNKAEIEKKEEHSQGLLNKRFWHQEHGPHDDALAIATWLYPEVVWLHCQWLVEKYTRQQKEETPWKEFLGDLHSWGRGLKKVSKAASLPQNEVPRSWPDGAEFQRLWRQLMNWGEEKLSLDKESIKHLREFCPARFLAFYAFAVRQKEKGRQKAQDISKPESDEN